MLRSFPLKFASFSVPLDSGCAARNRSETKHSERKRVSRIISTPWRKCRISSTEFLLHLAVVLSSQRIGSSIRSSKQFASPTHTSAPHIPKPKSGRLQRPRDLAITVIIYLGEEFRGEILIQKGKNAHSLSRKGKVYARPPGSVGTLRARTLQLAMRGRVLQSHVFCDTRGA